jgi:hypothetical protein
MAKNQYLAGVGGWLKKPPAPKLPPEVIANTAEKYCEALTRLVGSDTAARGRACGEIRFVIPAYMNCAVKFKVTAQFSS